MRSRIILAIMNAAAVDAMSARSFFRGSAPANPLIFGGSTPAGGPTKKLGLLPFSLGEALLPGERRSLRVTDDALVSMVELACRGDEHSCIGQLLLGPEGDAFSIVTLLEMEECKMSQDALSGGSVMLAKVRCMGRLRLLNIEQAEDSGHLIGVVDEYADDAEDPASAEEDLAAALAAALAGDAAGAADAVSKADAQNEAAEAAMKAVAASAEASGVPASEVVAAASQLLANLEGEVRKSHAAVSGLRSKLAQPGGPVRLPWQVGNPDSEQPLAWLEAEWTCDLEEIIASRRAVLLASAGEGESSTDLRTALRELGWGVETDEQAERALLSFAAAASMGKEVRTHALLTACTTERITASLCALREAERRLAAKVSLQRLGQ